MSRPSRLVGAAAWALPLAALVALGWVWHLDRAREWRTPSLGGSLVRLAAAPDSGRATWLVAVNPECPHCLQVLARLRRQPPRDAQVGALVVDTPARADAARLAGRVAPLWWDARGAWRREWGHRVYGEVLCFDPQGRYLRTRLPD